MRFNSKRERDELIQSFETKAKELTAEKIANPKTDKNYNTKVDFDHRSEFDVLEYENDGIEIKDCTGDIYVFYIHQPSLTQAIKIITAAKPPMGNEYNSGIEAWEIMIDKKESSPEVFTDRIKLGYLLRLIGKIDALLSDQKKS